MECTAKGCWIVLAPLVKSFDTALNGSAVLPLLAKALINGLLTLYIYFIFLERITSILFEE